MAVRADRVVRPYELCYAPCRLPFCPSAQRNRLAVDGQDILRVIVGDIG